MKQCGPGALTSVAMALSILVLVECVSLLNLVCVLLALVCRMAGRSSSVRLLWCVCLTLNRVTVFAGF